MSKFILTAAIALTALGFATIDSAKAQVIVTGGYSQGYYGGYSPGYFGGGPILQTGGTGFYYGYSSYPSYGYNYYPTYSGYSNYSPALNAYYDFYRRGASGNNYNYGGRRWR